MVKAILPATASRNPTLKTTRKSSERKTLTATAKQRTNTKDMVKIKDTKQDYEMALAQAALLFSGWMSRFEEPTSPEQEAVVRATVDWIQNLEKLLHENL
jgi:hypothetical protein